MAKKNNRILAKEGALKYVSVYGYLCSVKSSTIKRR